MPSLRTSARRRATRCASVIGGRHELVGLVGGVAEHHSLVAGPGARVILRVVDALRDVRRLALDRGQRPACLPVEPEAAVVVADLAHRAAHDLLDVDVVRRRHLAEHEDEAGRRRHLDGASRGGVVGQHVIEDGIGDGVAQLVRVALGHRLRGEQDRCRVGHLGARLP